MTDAQPPYNPLSDSQTEVLGTEPSGRGRGLIIALVAVLVVGVLGGGAWAAYSFLSGAGPRPEEALPASTVAVISVDLDPSAGQKIAAIKSIRKFPSLKKALGLKADDDLRKFIFDKATESGDCSDVNFDKSVKPWIGKRAAFGAVDLGGDSPAPVIALQITDADKARTGFKRIADCAGAGSDFKWAIGKDYLIASDSQKHADTILTEGQKKPLSEDPAYKRWHNEVGDAGVINFYVSKRATKYLTNLLDQAGNDLLGGGGPGSAFDQSAYSGEDLSGLSAPRRADDPDPFASIRDQLNKFEGLAGTVRFAGGGMELSVVAGGLGTLAPTAKVGEQVGALPSDTALALGFGVPADLAKEFTDSFKSQAGDQAGDALSSIKDQTGLSLPDDLQTLLGDSLVLSVSGKAPKDLANIHGFEDIPVALVIHGDAAKIKKLIARIELHTGFKLSDVPIEIGGDAQRVVLSPSHSYAAELATPGALGRSKKFIDALPDANHDTSVAYLDFDSAWRESLLRFASDNGASDSDVKVADQNTKPLKSFGTSSWLVGDVSHFLLKIATD